MENIQDGSNSILGEACKILNENKIDYIIVGGWSPYLLNSGEIKHPGTKDVDILFKSAMGKGDLDNIVNIFLENDFIPSAKHPFQLLKTKLIKSDINHSKSEKEYPFVYNIDLLHPGSSQNDPEMFVDQIEFPIKESSTLKANYWCKTIVLPKSDFYFENSYIEKEIEYENKDGKKLTEHIKLLNETGLILSKSESIYNSKRTRDAFDIFLAISQSPRINSTIEKLKLLASNDKEINYSLKKMLINIENYDTEKEDDVKNTVIISNIILWINKLSDSYPIVNSSDVKFKLLTFFESLNLQ